MAALLVVIVNIFFLFQLVQSECTYFISELNSDTPEEAEASEFIELRMQCPIRKARKHHPLPSLDGKLLVLH